MKAGSVARRGSVGGSASLLARGGKAHAAAGWMQTAASIKPAASTCLDEVHLLLLRLCTFLNVFIFFLASTLTVPQVLVQRAEQTRPLSNATSGTKAIVMAIVDGAELGEFTDTDNVIAVLSRTASPTTLLGCNGQSWRIGRIHE